MHKRFFIVRPFGTQQGVDFNAVEALLIQPAVKGVQSFSLDGGTTLPFVEAGNIREDMFRELVTADLVIADLTIHNANVFYELGIRHGLRPNATVMVRAEIDKYPFDLQTDRYLIYDHKNPAAAVDVLVKTLEATLTSSRVDSPVYQLLPSLVAPDPALLRVIPREFGEAVGRAREAGLRGDLRLLAYEAKSFPWASEGLRVVGQAQFILKAFRGAKETFEWLREIRPDDVEANQRLGTIYQRMAREENDLEYLAKSNAAIQRVIDSPIPGLRDVAEAYALKARNIKARWLERIRARSGTAAQTEALRAAELADSIDSYAAGFAQDLNHFYSGLNALSLLRIRLDLAGAHPDVWGAAYDTDAEARTKLEEAEARFQQLAGAVRLSIDASLLALERQKNPDEERKLWTGISVADLAFLIAPRSSAVARRYREALSGAPDFALSSVRDQIEIFQQLAVRPEFVTAALAVIDELKQATPGGPAAAGGRLGRVLQFTGHMVDAPGRAEPRFPRTPEAEAEARRMIRAAVAAERALEEEPIVGIAGGASGGDILFHEVCAELGIESRLFLALPPNEFSAESVQHGGPQWVERFYHLCERVKPRVLADSKQLPAWLGGKVDYSIWQRNNLWMLFTALSLDAKRFTLIALWDQGPADGPGGTQDLVGQVRSRGYKVELLPAERLKALAQP